jgi:hypothetical protein
METVFRMSLISESVESQSRSDEIDLLNNHAAVYGYTMKCNVPYDGNCFFHSVCVELERPESGARDLREELVAFLKTKVCGIHWTIDFCNNNL